MYLKPLLIRVALCCLLLGYMMAIIACLCFSSAKLSVPDIVCVLKCNSARVLFEEFLELKLRLLGGHLWSEGYAGRTAGPVPNWNREEYINRS